MSDFVTKIPKKKLKDYTPEELELCREEPGTSPNHIAAVGEIHRRQMDAMAEKQDDLNLSVDRLHHARCVDIAILIVGAISAIAGVILLFR